MTNVDAGEAVSPSTDDSGPAANSVELAVTGRIGVVRHEQETLDADAEFPATADPVDLSALIRAADCGARSSWTGIRGVKTPRTRRRPQASGRAVRCPDRFWGTYRDT